MNSTQINNSITLHGVFLEVFGNGVLIIGRSGIGKSELALGLIHMGHRLIADDHVIIDSHNQSTLMGHCDPLLQNLLEVRGLGILDIKALYGDSAVKESNPLHLIIEIKEFSPIELSNIDRVRGLQQTKTLLTQSIEQITIPFNSSRNLVLLVETAVRKQKLVNSGYDASHHFCKQQFNLLQSLDLGHSSGNDKKI